MNRVSFLRGDNKFLSAAFRHPSTTFLLFNELKPLVSSPQKLASVSARDLEPLVGADPWSKSEEEIVEEYDSSRSTPQMVFLGLADKEGGKQAGEGFVWNELYKGSPWFAVDVTPKGSYADEAKAIISEVEGKGLKFQEGRQVMSLPAGEGEWNRSADSQSRRSGH